MGKISREKQIKRALAIYQNTFGFRVPFQILCIISSCLLVKQLVDGNFIVQGCKHKMDLMERLPKMMHNECQLLVTPCVIHEMQDIKAQFDKDMSDDASEKRAIMRQALSLARRTFKLRMCPHAKSEHVASNECLKSMTSIESCTQLLTIELSKYMVATQDQELRKFFRSCPGVPLLYIAKSIIIFEEMSAFTLSKARKIEVTKTLPTVLENIGKDEKVSKDEKSIKKKRKTKAPNPLSCLKKKKTTEKKASVEDSVQTRKVRTRKHKNFTITEIQK